MNQPKADAIFAGSVPELYDSLMVPLIFEPYAEDIARRVAALNPKHVLETAAGTGAVTRALARSLPPHAELTATDLNQPMLDRAAAVGAQRPVAWKQADAMKLPFDDESFDVVVCQFGVMFFPDRPHAYAEARRVLRPGGTFIFNAWDRIEENEFAHTVTKALATLFPTDPPMFMARTPHGYHDRVRIAADLAQAGFTTTALIERVTARSRAASAEVPAMAYCQGTNLRGEIEARGGTLTDATAACTRAIETLFGSGEVDGKIQANVVTIRR
ncbi:class I SAM-dependent methyltransferase [Piscinibacter terrae]|uniref:Class I SAM-dependent methyltransferase n=1 Tax=Piscinibacter terrae TaxID=2496871 RepID=A0A3N7HN67_9BURK|nr:class I SAM-dependent methyltransferase [Albitalea terrae]RQP23063.1 class I SAM-dependent methyltransferase [Albitalea terrae]